MVPFWVRSRIRHLVFRGPKGDHNFDNQSYLYVYIYIYMYATPPVIYHFHLLQPNLTAAAVKA